MVLVDMGDHTTDAANPLLIFLTERRWGVVRHAMLIFVFALVFLQPGNGVQIDISNTERNATISFLFSVAFFIIFLSIIYLNLYLFVPHLLAKGKYMQYFLAISGVVLVLFAVIYLVDTFYFAHFYGTHHHATLTASDLVGFAFIHWLVIGAITSIKLFQLWITGTYRIIQLEKYQLQSELSFLKSQINPHFLFNMLNSVHVLQQQDVGKASELVLKLSDLLRYQLYDSVCEKVMLSADIRFIHDLLQLEKVRRSKFEYDIQVDGDINGIFLPPFLFIPFVENALKHNVDARKTPMVHISFKTHPGELVYQCINSKPETQEPGKVGGLGLKNVRRRLELLYRGTYRLDIVNDTDKFIVNLKVPI